MSYYGGGPGGPPPPHLFNQGPRGPPPPHMMYGPSGPHPQEMYDPSYAQGPDYNDYNGGGMHPTPYGGGGPGPYYDPANAPMYGYPAGPTMGVGGPPPFNPGGYEPRPHINPKFIPPENPPAPKEEPTKILRNPYPSVSKEEMKKGQKDDIYDPSCPTLVPSGPPNDSSRNQNNSSRNAPQNQMQFGQNQQQQYHHEQQQQYQPPPQQQQSYQQQPQQQQYHHEQQHQQPPQQQQYHHEQQHQQPPQQQQYHHEQQQQNYQQQPQHQQQNFQQQQPPQQYVPMVPPPSAALPAPVPTPIPFQQTVAAPPPPNISKNMFGSSSSNASTGNQPPPSQRPSSTMRIMTGVVTQMTPGAFGMISEEIFFQEACVSGAIPRLGDKVVVEAEPVNGMPFKFNAKKVTRLDVDLVHEEKAAPVTINPTPAPPPIQQQQPQQQQNSVFEWSFNNYDNRPAQGSNVDRSDRMDFAPLPAMPDTLNLRKQDPPRNLSSMMPSELEPQQLPLKSILKNRGNLQRNPPPPPVISKTGAATHVVDEFRPSGGVSTYKSSNFLVDLDRDIPRVLPASGNGPGIEFPEYTYVKEDAPPSRQAPPLSPRITRLLPGSPGRDQDRSAGFDRRLKLSPTQRKDDFSPRDRHHGTERFSSRDVGVLDWRLRSRSRSKSPPSRSAGKRRSSSPVSRRSRRSRSVSPKDKGVRVRRSPSPRSAGSPRGRRKHSRSQSPRSRRRSRSRSISPHSSRRRRSSRSVSRDRRRSRSTSRSRRNYRSRRTSKSRSKSPHGRVRRRRSGSSSIKSVSPSRPGSHRSQVVEETTRGIVVKHVSSDLFPRMVDRELEATRISGPHPAAPSTSKPKTQPVPIKFQIATAVKPPPTLVPNPSFKANAIATSAAPNAPAYNITKTVTNNSASQWTAAGDAKNKKKKPKEQEPAFKIKEDKPPAPVAPKGKTPAQIAAEDKIKQWEAERQQLKAKTTENLLKNPMNVVHLKQTIQKDLNELRAKGPTKEDAGKKLLENPNSILQLKQTVERDLQELKNKGNKNGGGGKSSAPVVSVNIQDLKQSVQQGLKDLRSKYDKTHGSQEASTSQQKPSSSQPSGPNLQKTIVNDQAKKISGGGPGPSSSANNNKIPVARSSPGDRNSSGSRGRSRDVPRNVRPPHHEPPPPPYNGEMERLQEDIHQQRLVDEEARLRAIGDEAGLQQLFFLEDRRRRRLEERHLARIRMAEIQFKKDKNFGELQLLRERWGPPEERLDAERHLREQRMAEEQRQSHLTGQAEAIRRHEEQYEAWLENEAAARLRGGGMERPGKGFEGRVKRRRTPSPPTHPHQGSRGGHSRSPSYERYRDDGGEMHPYHPHHGPPPEAFYPHPGMVEFPPGPEQFDRDGFIISRAIDDVSRRQEELMHREMEMQHRMEMAGRRMGTGPPHPPPHHQRERGDYGRYAVSRR